MSTALKSEPAISPGASLSAQRRKQRRLTVLPPQQSSATKLVALPRQRQRPLWLTVLMASQWISGTAALLALTGAATIYGLTVNTNRQLTSAATALEQLQAQQRQLTAAKAVFQNHLAQTISDNLPDITLHPKDVIFLETDEVPNPSPQTVPDTAQPAPSHPRFYPKGY